MNTEMQEAIAFIRERTQYQPKIGLVLGSGLSPLAQEIENADIIPYTKIPHFPSSTVQGHSGQLVIGEIGEHQVVVMQGRVHFYEGYSMRQVVFPIRIMGLLGIHTLIVTNAAGGLAEEYTPGDLMLIKDHINFVGMAGQNPLIGPNDPDLGPRFPDMAHAYDPALRQLARQVAQDNDIPLHQGVYICLAGPSFETPYEVRFLRMIGVDAVGMSTVPEVIAARHMDLRVLGISSITNVHSTDPDRPYKTSHQEVLEAGKTIAPRMIALIRGILEKL
jgi:purine-nucleoside phosphorylase